MEAGSEPVAATGELTANLEAIRRQSTRPQTLARVRRSPRGGRRGWLMRRSLVAADLVGLSTAFLLTNAVLGSTAGTVSPMIEPLVFTAALPVWIVVAQFHGLYEKDEERTDHSTVDELAGVFHVVSIGVWLVFAVSWLTGLAVPDPTRLVFFWLSAIALVTGSRASARAIARQTDDFRQNAVIVGAGDVGQLIARKFLQHPEYGITVVGLVDDAPKARRRDLGGLPLLGPPAELPDIVGQHGIDRVVFAFSNASHAETLELVRSLDDHDVQIDLIPRLFEIIGPRASLHTVEGLALVGLSPAHLSRSSRLIKRTVDVVGALFLLALASPLFLYAALRIKRQSPGPVFFRQTRLGLNGREFTMLKFRTMRPNIDQIAHRQYIKSIADAKAAPEGIGLYKLDVSDCVFPFGGWLRRTSLDELPQLINVVRGDMSLVGPRPCLPYEVENFQAHHFERFAVLPGITGLWQVTARAHSTFGEALDMDVAYVRGWSLRLDFSLLWKTPVHLVRGDATV
jgi:exopolysaccharide biosynthesis polyprenyl glycosylphosphotransferase